MEWWWLSPTMTSAVRHPSNRKVPSRPKIGATTTNQTPKPAAQLDARQASHPPPSANDRGGRPWPCRAFPRSAGSPSNRRTAPTRTRPLPLRGTTEKVSPVVPCDRRLPHLTANLTSLLLSHALSLAGPTTAHRSFWCCARPHLIDTFRPFTRYSFRFIAKVSHQNTRSGLCQGDRRKPSPTTDEAAGLPFSSRAFQP